MSSPEGWGQLWRWPLYSPRRFFSCVAVVLALIAVSNMILGGGGGLPPPDRAVATPSATPTGPTATNTTPIDASPAPAESGLPAGPPSTDATVTTTPRPASPDGPQKAASIALAFTRAWADHARPAAQWWQAVSRYADPEFAAQLRSTDPKNVPASKVTGAAHPLSVFFASASVEVPTDAGPVVVELVSDGHLWQVTDIHPKR
jgi:hypothetical protein